MQMIEQTKKHNVIYTPEWVVDLILGYAVRGYTAGTRVRSPACGDGAFLAKLVTDICDKLLAKNKWLKINWNLHCVGATDRNGLAPFAVADKHYTETAQHLNLLP